MMNSPGRMGIGDIIDVAFMLYRRRFRTFVAIAGIIYVPYSLLLALLFAGARRYAPEAPPEDDKGMFNVFAGPNLDLRALSGNTLGHFVMPAVGGALSLIAILALVFAVGIAVLVFLTLVYPLCSSALVINISAEYTGTELSAFDSYRRVTPRLGRLLTAQFLATVCIVFGALFCILPGVLVMLWFMLVPAVAILEDHGPAGTLGRSRELMRGNVLRGLLLGFLVWLISAVISYAGTWLVERVPWPTEFVPDFLSGLIEALTLPFAIGAIVLFYYDLRIRKDGVLVSTTPLEPRRPPP
jgi:hypothetical protein